MKTAQAPSFGSARPHSRLDRSVTPAAALSPARRGRRAGGARRRPSLGPRAALLAALALTGLLPGCDSSAADQSLSEARIYEPIGRRIRWNATADERHGVSARDFSGAGASGSASGAAAGGAAAADSLHWTTPVGWQERPPAMFREANFQVAGDERAECYLTTLAGDAGGLEANINRWRTQVSLPPLSAAELAALPRVPWLGGQATFVDFEGVWQGMSGDESESGYRLVGLALMGMDRSRFLKMTGPAAVVGPQIGAFRALADSFHDGAGHSHGPAKDASSPATPQSSGKPSAASAPSPTSSPSASSTAPAASGSTAPSAASAAPADPQGNSALTWRTPAGWVRGPDKSMREVTYFAGEGQSVECYVTLLAGTGGGLLANINRWAGQMGAPTLGEAELAGLERVSMAGTEAVLIELQRGPGATLPEGQDLMLGTLCLLSDRALFVKLTGPREPALAQRAALIEFSQSLRTTR